MTFTEQVKRIPAFTRGGVPERPMGADCKSAGLRLRRFESSPLHQTLESWGESAMRV
ncbi:hypothetical protein CCP4SC76_1650010 [Gammaproteobacteria bacterium]